MELDTNYSSVKICPTTGEWLNQDEWHSSEGVCPRCGDKANSTFTHHTKLVGLWNRPSVWEWIKGERQEFIETPRITKSSNDI
jgi:hypothetical protein